MPQAVTIDLPLVITGRGGQTMVRPIGFPEYAIAASKPDNAIRNAKRRVTKACRDYVGTKLIGRLIRGDVKQAIIEVEIAPPKKSGEWRESIDIELDTFVWSQNGTLVITYVPALDLTVVASPGTDIDKLVQEQVRSAIRRADNWTLAGLAGLDCYETVTLDWQQIELQLQTPTELAKKAQKKPTSKTPTLKAVATKLSRKSLRPAYHRDDDVELLAQLLSGKNPRSVLLVGPAGVGKTAIFHEWVRNRDRWNMRNVQCWATDGSRLISGQTGFGMWQKQCLAMADEAAKYPSVIHLGNIVELTESGRLRGSGGCGSLLAPRLADGSLVAVIEATSEQLTRMQRTEPRLVAALTTLNIDEPTPEQTRSILLEAAATWKPVDISADLKHKRKQKRGRSLGKKKRKALRRAQQKESEEQLLLAPVVVPEALQVLDRLHRRFQTDAASPGRPLAFFHAVMSEMEPGETLDDAKVIEAFGRQTGLPEFLVDDAVRPNLVEIEDQLASQVLGQDEVITALVDVIATLAADLSRGDRPLASMMLIGPTGVGKTETAKALARLIYSDASRMIRIDMSELSGPTAVGRLIGDAVNPDGLLTAAVRAQPFSLVLLDEFEKAHTSVFDLLLQVLGEGRLTDGNGRVADFRNSIVLMTSNLGVESFKTSPLGLADTQRSDRYHNHFERQVRAFLRPEMFNRIDRILSYDPLPQEIVEQIAAIRMKELESRDGWKHNGNLFDVSAEVTPTLARDGYQPQYGARPLVREVERTIVVPLSDSICKIGRHNPVDVQVDVEEFDHSPSKVTVNARARRSKDKKHASEIRALLCSMTTLRRRGQALDRSSLVRDLRNRITTMKRSWRHLNAKDRREMIMETVRGRYYRKLKEQERAVERITEKLNRAESELLLEFHRENTIDMDRAKASTEQLKGELWDMLCQLQTPRSTDNQRITLVLTGANLAIANPLLDGYVELAKTRGWNLQAHAILPRDKSGTRDRVIDVDGWSAEPSFRVDTGETKEQSEDDVDLDAILRMNMAQSWVPVIANTPSSLILSSNEKKDKPKLAAYGLIQLSKLKSFPPGTLGLMLSFGGKSAELMLASEAGIHSFRSDVENVSALTNAILITKHTGTPIQYTAPHWLASGEVRQTGSPRRGYDVKNNEVIDLSEDGTYHLKMDREGKWLEKVLEREMERRVWAALEE